MTARWDLANAWENGNDHGLFNNGDEPGVSKWNPRPAFYYMYYFQKLFGDRMLSSSVIGGNVLSYASSFTSGQKSVVIINKSTTNQIALVTLENATPGSRYYYYVLTGGSDNGEFSRKVFVNGKGPTGPSGGPSNEYTSIKAFSASTTGGIKFNLPARSVIYLVIDK